MGGGGAAFVYWYILSLLKHCLKPPLKSQYQEYRFH